ncbi:MAG: NAD(P)/FAD-dependent oxidoreductase [Actinomycetes bacterium]
MSEPTSQRSARPADIGSVDAVVVGAGFAGMYMLHRLRGLGLNVRVFEAGGGVGGTWYWNRYPGAHCDIDSLEYSYQFSDELQHEWDWSERYGAQPEILDYANHVADRFDLRRDIHFDTKVMSAQFNEHDSRWIVRTDAGDELSAHFFIMATGCLSSANTPDLPGMDAFAGEIFHTGRWPHEGVDFANKRVGIIGTGSSGIQAIPIIAEQAGELTVFQRTAAWVVPAGQAATDPEVLAATRADYAGFRQRNSEMMVAFGSKNPSNDASALDADDDERQHQFEMRWNHGGLPFLGAFNDLMFDPNANAFAAEFVRSKIRETVHDQSVAELLCPDTLIGCKRLCLGTNYYETYNRPNVNLIDVSQEPIAAITPNGLQVGSDSYDLDVIVFATGFDAMTGAIMAVDIRGRSGTTIQEAWEAGPRTYLGLGIVGFPNMFTISGPGSPSVLTNMIVSIEQHVNWIADCIGYVRDQGHRTIEASASAQDEWVEWVNAVANLTLYPSCNSWYLGANIPGKTRVFMPLLGFPPYVEKCNAVAANNYEGFNLAG